MLPKFPINVAFDPEDNPGTSQLWAIPAGRLLMLLWRPTHLCSADWFREALVVAKRIERDQPKDAAALELCFWDVRNSVDFTTIDVRRFCSEAIDYFAGRDEVQYCGEVSGVARMGGDARAPAKPKKGAR